MIAPARDLEPAAPAPVRDDRRQRHRRTGAPLLPPRGEQPAPTVIGWQAWTLTAWIVGVAVYYLWTLSEVLVGR